MLLLVLLLLHLTDTVCSTDPSAENSSTPFSCGGVERYIAEDLQGPNDTVNPDSLVPQETGRASVVPDLSHRFLQSAFNINTTWNIWGPGNATHRGRAQGAAADADGFLPFHISFVLIPSIDRENIRRLGHALTRVHRLFLNLMKAIPLDDPRLPRVREFGPPDPVTGKTTFIRCKEPNCARFRVPGQYVGPCFDSDDNYVPEPDVTRYMQLEIAMWYSVNTSMVIYVQHNDYDDEVCKRYVDANAYAQICGWLPTNGRPTHGRIVFCKEAKSKDLESVFHTLAHETLHVITDGEMMGQHFFDQYGVPPNQWADYHLKSRNEKKALALGKTYKTESRPWMNKAGVVETKSFSYTILPKVQQAVRDHFQCPTAEGAEINGLQDTGHWSIRLFPDELMAGSAARIRRLSDITLGVVDSASYYKVNSTYKGDPLLYEPEMYSRPKERGCEVYNKSCYDIFSKISDQNAHFLGPYCDPTDRVITTRCSPDGRAKLKCTRDPRVLKATDGCHILETYESGMEFNINGKIILLLNGIYCREIPADWKTFTTGGPNSLCVTFHNISSQAQGHPKLNGIQAGCPRYVCHEDYLELNFYGTPCSKEICRTSGVIQQWGTAVPNCDLLSTTGSYQCPNIEAVCKSQRPRPSHRETNDTDQPAGVARQDAVICDAVIFGVGMIWVLVAC